MPKLGAVPRLRPYQLQGVRWMMENPRTLLGSDMGLGKSVQALMATSGPTLIVAPAMAIHGRTWADEIARWAPERAHEIVQVPYTSLLDRNGRLVLEQAKKEYRGPWESVILDEAHMLKSRKAKWTKPIQKLCREAGFVRMLTGTPIKNFAPDIFTLLQILRPETAKSGGDLGSYWRWADKWFNVMETDIRTRRGVVKTTEINGLRGCACQDEWWAEEGRSEWVSCEHYEEFFTANFGDLFKRHLRDECLPDLPPLTRQVIECPMVPAQLKAYRGLKRDFVAEMPDGALKVAWNSPGKNTIIDRCATGLGIMDDGVSIPLDAESGKLSVLRGLLENRSRPTLVFGHFRQSVEAAAMVARSLGRTVSTVHGGTSPAARGETVKAFQAGQIDVLVGSLATMSASLTLTAADCVIFLETTYSPSDMEQAARRIHRIGQENACTLYDLVTPNSIDEHKRAMVQTKTDAQMALLTYAQFAEMI